MSNEQAPAGNKEFFRQTALAVIWNYLSFGLSKGLVFLSTAILARVLSKADFGIVGFATIIIDYLSVLNDLGLGSALIQRQENVEESAETVFTFNILLGAGLTLLTYLVAPWVAIYFREPEVTPILRVLGLTFILSSLSSTHTVWLKRQLAFQRKIIPDLGRAIMKGGVSIFCALNGFGPWSLVYGQLAGVLTGLLLTWIVYPWFPRWRLHRALLPGLLQLGFSMMGVTILNALVTDIDYVIVGRRLGSEALGSYMLAFRLPELLILNLLWVVGNAIFPAYASIQSQPEVLRRGFLATMRYMALFAVPLCLGLTIVADPLVRVAFGENWLNIVPVVRLLSASMLVSLVASNVGDVAKAIGRPQALIRLGITLLPIQIAGLWLGSYWGLIGVTMGHLFTAIVRMVLQLRLSQSIIQCGWREILAEIRPAGWGAIGLVGVTTAVNWLIWAYPPLVRLLLLTVTGGLVYLMVLQRLAPALISQVWTLFRRGKRRGEL